VVVDGLGHERGINWQVIFLGQSVSVAILPMVGGDKFNFISPAPSDCLYNWFRAYESWQRLD